MDFHFTASGVYADDDGTVLMLVLNSDDEEHYFSVQQSLEHDEQSIKAGMNTYYIERDDQGFGGYGGLDEIRLSKTELKAVLNEKGKKNLNAENLAVTLNIPEESFYEMKEMLIRIFSPAGILKLE